MRGTGSILLGVLALVGALALANTVLSFAFGLFGFLFGWVERLVLAGAAFLAGAGTLSAFRRQQTQLAVMLGTLAVLAAWGALRGWSLIPTAILALLCIGVQAFVARSLRAA